MSWNDQESYKNTKIMFHVSWDADHTFEVSTFIFHKGSVQIGPKILLIARYRTEECDQNMSFTWVQRTNIHALYTFFLQYGTQHRKQGISNSTEVIPTIDVTTIGNSVLSEFRVVIKYILSATKTNPAKTKRTRNKSRSNTRYRWFVANTL